uniref:Uncharacterized protein n=1 Tax=Meloidogyne javanica TaxID=6303 RepID=A0A915MAN3_MELJA
SKETSEQHTNNIPESVGKIILANRKIKQSDPGFWDELARVLPSPIVRESPEEPFYEQIHSPSQSAFV